jgi:hypothetical protein
MAEWERQMWACLSNFCLDIFWNDLAVQSLNIQCPNWAKKDQGSKFMTKWPHLRSKFMGCDSIVNAIRTVRIQKLLLVRLVFNCATNRACVSKSNKVLMLSRTDVFSHFTPEFRSPLYRTTKAPWRADIYQKSTRTELSSIIHSLPVLEIPPDIWMPAWLRSLQVNLALRWDPIMIQCTLSSCETDCIACSHAPPELPASSGCYRNTKWSELDCFRSFLWP